MPTPDSPFITLLVSVTRFCDSGEENHRVTHRSHRQAMQLGPVRLFLSLRLKPYPAGTKSILSRTFVYPPVLSLLTRSVFCKEKVLSISGGNTWSGLIRTMSSYLTSLVRTDPCKMEFVCRQSGKRCRRMGDVTRTQQ